MRDGQSCVADYFDYLAFAAAAIRGLVGVVFAAVARNCPRKSEQRALAVLTPASHAKRARGGLACADALDEDDHARAGREGFLLTAGFDVTDCAADARGPVRRPRDARRCQVVRPYGTSSFAECQRHRARDSDSEGDCPISVSLGSATSFWIVCLPSGDCSYDVFVSVSGPRGCHLADGAASVVDVAAGQGRLPHDCDHRPDSGFRSRPRSSAASTPRTSPDFFVEPLVLIVPASCPGFDAALYFFCPWRYRCAALNLMTTSSTCVVFQFEFACDSSCCL